jgi:hypothetical protein
MKIQIDDLVRDATAEEMAHLQSEANKVANEKAETQAKEAAKVSALAKLAALGLTSEEISAIS